MASRTHEQILAIVRTDRTFSRVIVREREVWGGKCIHCKGHLYVGLDGKPVSRATIEHIRPRAHGGTDELANLALACARCNHQKGCRLDNRSAGDPDLERMIERLAERRAERWREPEDAG
jgi:5-methylcytosine-specific restriction endonuclease McrA